MRETVACNECRKPRCVYAERALTNREHRELKGIVRKYDFVCGCSITPDVSFLSGTVFTRLELSCQSPLEWPYFAATKVSVRKDICAYCCRKGVSPDAKTKKKFKTVLPICLPCKAMGRKELKRGPLGKKPSKTR